MIPRLAIGVTVALAAIAIPATAALAEHDHYVLTPNGKCHQVAAGQTALAGGHGGHHRFHANVHLGATESATAPDALGDGHAAAQVYREGPAPAVCDGD